MTEINLKLTGIAPTGEAIGRADGLVLFVPFGLPGETVSVEIEHQRRNFGRARLVKVITPAPERVKPSGAWTDRGAALVEFNRLREETIAYASTTADPLRERWFRLPVGEVDGVQALVMIAGHMARHQRQLRGVVSA